MSDQRKERCATCRWWSENLYTYGENTPAYAIENHKRELSEVGGMGRCSVFPEHMDASGLHFCGQWRERG